jgi:hypothetical protein
MLGWIVGLLCYFNTSLHVVKEHHDNMHEAELNGADDRVAKELSGIRLDQNCYVYQAKL